jgi:hypothetical protein
MNRDYFSIGTDVDFQQDRYVYRNHVGSPDNKRECPCDKCPLMDRCADKFTECSAMRTWQHGGDYKDSDLQRYIRAIKV